MEQLGGWKRSRYCGTLRAADAGQRHTLMGWVQRRRDLGSLIFITLRDRSGIVQVVFDQAVDAALFERAAHLRSEYVLAVQGEVVRREDRDINTNMPTGQIELCATALKLLNTAETPPFGIESDTVSEVLRLQYRYLDLRRAPMQRSLAIKDALTHHVRAYMHDNGFMDIETPMLTKSTPEGARDYLVPSRVQPGNFFALPQSPQLFKQLLMVAGFDRYYQITKCFRDEDLRANRQPEFQQIDFEMSFVEREDVMQLAEGLMRSAFAAIRGVELPDPLPRMTYAQAIDLYGSDKPDTRFAMPIQDVSRAMEGCAFPVFADALAGGGCVCALNAQGAAARFTRKELDALQEVARAHSLKGVAWYLLDAAGTRTSIAKFLDDQRRAALERAAAMQPGDALFLMAGEYQSVHEALGELRLMLGRKLDLIDPDSFAMLWVTDFPLLEYDPEEGRYVAKHHPFTAPMPEDLPLLQSDPAAVRAQAYDIVCNGDEIGGGSIRIYDRALQERMFALLGFTPQDAQERFGFLLDAFKYGAPPHGGLAFGLDRLVMTLAGLDNIRDAIAFPKVQSSSCLLTDAPSTVQDKQLRELSIAVLGSQS